MSAYPVIIPYRLIPHVLAHRVSQLRRPIWPQPDAMVEAILEPGNEMLDEHFDQWHGFDVEHDDMGYASGCLGREHWRARCPYGDAGSTLWVKETFVVESSAEVADESYTPPWNDGRPVEWVDSDWWGRYWMQAHYRATDPTPELSYEGTDEPTCRWQPPVAMPRWASRITLHVTEVRVARLHDLSEADAGRCIASSCPWMALQGVKEDDWTTLGPMLQASFKNAFATDWDARYHRRGLGWRTNPYVWVIDFRSIAPKGSA